MMGKRNLKKVFLGIIFIFISIMLAVAAFYQLEVKPELASREMKAMAAGDTPEEGVGEMKVNDPQKPEPAGREKIIIEYEDGKSSVRSIDPQETEKTEVLAHEEKNKTKSGHLWIDRKSSKYVVTLGKKDGLAVGSRLVVFQEDQKIGTVEVDSIYETLAYVFPIDISENLTENDYYSVVFER